MSKEDKKITGEEFVEKNQKILSIVGVAIVVVIAAVFGYRYMTSQKNETAQSEIFQSQYYFEKDSLDLALNGDGRSLGFLDIIDEYGSTKAGNLAYFYTGAIYLKKRENEKAIEYLSKFSTGEDLVQARAFALTGDAYMELGNYSDAADAYEKAAGRCDDKYFSPGYLIKAALAHEKNNDYQSAIASMNKIIKEYYGASEYNEARKHKARLEGLASS